MINNPEESSSTNLSKVMFDSLPFGVVCQGADGVVLSANLAAQKILGQTLDQLQARPSSDPLWRAIHEDGSDFSTEDHPGMRALRTGQTIQDVVMGVYNLQSGAYTWINVSVVPQTQNHGVLPCMAVYTLEDISRRMQAEKQILQLTRLNDTLSQINQALLRARTQDELLEAVCKVVVEYGEFRMAWVGFVDRQMGQVNIKFTCGQTYPGQMSLPINVNQLPYQQSMIGSALRTDRVIVCNDLLLDPNMLHLREVAVQGHFRSAALIPLHNADQTVALLGLFAAEMDFFSSPKELKLLEEIGLNVSYALDRLEVEAGRKYAEEKLQANERTLKLFVEYAPAAIAMFDQEMKYIAASRRFLSDYHLSAGDIAGRSHYEIFPEIPERWKAIHRRCLAGAIEKADEDPFPRRDGSIDWVRWEIHPWYDVSGEVGGIILFSEVVTDRKRIDTQIAELVERYELASRSAHLGVWDWDIARDQLVWDDHMYELYGVNKDDFTAAYDAWLNGLHPDDRAISHEVVQQALRGEKEYDTEFRVIWPDGSIHWLKSYGKVIRDATGKPLREIGVNFDITDQKSAEAKIRQQADRLKILADASLAFSAVSQDYQSVLDQVVRQVEELLADMCQIRLLSDDGEMLDLVAVHSRDPELSKALSALKYRVSMDTNIPNLKTQVFLSGVASFVPRITVDQLRATLPPTSWAIYKDYFKEDTTLSYIMAPLNVQGRCIGVMSLFRYWSERLPFTEEDLSLAQDLANRAALVINNARLVNQLQKELVDIKRAEVTIENQLHHLSALRTIDVAITSSLDLRVTLHVLLEHVLAQLRVDASAVLLLDHSLNELEYTAGRGFYGNNITRMRLRLGEGYAGKAALERRTIYIQNFREADPPIPRSEWIDGENFTSLVAVPLIAKGQVNGLLIVYQRAQFSPNPDWLEFLEMLAGQAAIAIDNAQLYDGLQRSNIDLALAYDATIQGWSRAMDLRDKETEGHTLRVTELTLQLARAAGMTNDQIAHARRGALLHDMGKLGVPDSILFKPAQLSEEEWEIMHKHPVYAYEMLSSIEYLRPALDIPYCHHEKWDGTGYPRGLKGEQIPLAARVFAVIDVWDALRSDRPYRASWPEEKVIEQIRLESGTHFDPKIVELFFQMLAEENSQFT